MVDIEVRELKEKRGKGEEMVLIDVREDFEYGMYNIGGKLIPLGTLPGRLEELKAFKDKEIVVICRSGMRSAAAKNLLEQNGFAKVRNLVGGVLAWQEAGYRPNDFNI